MALCGPFATKGLDKLPQNPRKDDLSLQETMAKTMALYDLQKAMKVSEIVAN